MVKKSTHWVTIPEEKLHTPASVTASSKKGGMSGKSKLFWGTSFVVLAIVTAALVAPTQLASLLQGNLFAPLEVIPTGEEAAVTEAQPAETVTTPETTEDTLVEAETEATAIQIEPVTTAEQPAATTTTTTEGQPAEVATDTAADTEVTGAIKDELDANRKLLEELSKQVSEFKQKDQAKTEVIEDLTAIVQEQISTDTELHPSAPESTPAVTATTTLGQAAVGYKFNTHTVTMTPYQVLQQNTAQMQQTQQAYLGQTAAQQQIYRNQLSQAQGTPDSGPREALMLTLILSFVGVLGWKFGKLARA